VYSIFARSFRTHAITSSVELAADASLYRALARAREEARLYTDTDGEPYAWVTLHEDPYAPNAGAPIWSNTDGLNPAYAEPIAPPARPAFSAAW
jgi:hypothetical protein